MQIVLHLLRGVAIGLANIIPGVSGGTMALILGIYERLIRAIKSVGLGTFLSVFRGRKAFVEEMKRVDALLVGALGVGALVAIVAAAKLLIHLLNKQHDPTYGFFFGLVLVSVIVPFRMVKKLSAGTVISALLGVTLVVGVTVALSGEQRVESARQKAAIKAAKIAKIAKADATKAATATKTPNAAPKAKRYSVPVDGASLLLFFISGAIAICAMILPGVSGSFVLLLMGVYFDVLACINERNFALLAVFALGCVLGLAFFARLINFMLQRYADPTLAFLGGLVFGSLYAIWPFKSFAVVAGQRVDMTNVLPKGFGGNELITLGAVVVGCVIVLLFFWIEKKQPKPDAV